MANAALQRSEKVKNISNPSREKSLKKIIEHFS